MEVHNVSTDLMPFLLQIRYLVQVVNVEKPVVKCTYRQAAKFDIGTKHRCAWFKTVRFCLWLFKLTDPVLQE